MVTLKFLLFNGVITIDHFICAQLHTYEYTALQQGPMIHFMLQREVRKLLAEGKIASYEKGEIVVKLMAEQQVSEEEALAAAATSDNIDTALQMLQQECQLCMNVMKITEVIVIKMAFTNHAFNLYLFTLLTIR